MPHMTDTWAIRLFQVTSTIGGCRGFPGRIPTATAQAIRDADDDDEYPRMPNDQVLRGMLKSGLRRQLGHNMRSLKACMQQSPATQPAAQQLRQHGVTA